MSDSVYRVTEVIGASPDSWEAAAQNAVTTAGQTIRDLRALGNVARLLDHKRAVHQEERLLGDSCVKSALIAGVGIGKVECAKYSRQILALNQCVKCPPRGEGFRVNFDRQAANFSIKLSCKLKQRVAQRFKIEPLPIHV